MEGNLGKRGNEKSEAEEGNEKEQRCNRALTKILHTGSPGLSLFLWGMCKGVLSLRMFHFGFI